MNNVKAFTILEMLINLTMMSIIMGLIYFAYSSFVQQVINYQRSIDEQNDLSRSYVQLKIDFYNADRVVNGYQGFKTVSYNNTEIEYTITNKYLIRKQIGVVDSLALNKIKIETVLHSKTKEDLITRMVINTSLFDEPIEFTVGKEYAPNLKLKL